MIPHQLMTLVRINGKLKIIKLSGQLGRSLPILELYGPTGSVTRLRRELNRFRRLLKLPSLNYRLTIELDQLPDKLEPLIWPLLYLMLTLGRNWPRLRYVVGQIESDGQIQPVDWFDDYGLSQSELPVNLTLLSARFRPHRSTFQTLTIDHLDPDLTPNALLTLATLLPLDNEPLVLGQTRRANNGQIQLQLSQPAASIATPELLNDLANYLPLLLLSGASSLIAGRTGIGKSRLVEDFLQYRCLDQTELSQAGLCQSRALGDRRLSVIRLESFSDWRQLDNWPIALPTLILVPELLDRSAAWLSRLKLLFDRIDRLAAPWQLVATTNLCPCGQFPDPLCRCLTQSRQRWLARLSPTLFDRFELVSCLVDNLQYDWPALARFQATKTVMSPPTKLNRPKSVNQAWRQSELEAKLLQRIYALKPDLKEATATAILRQYRFAYLELIR